MLSQNCIDCKVKRVTCAKCLENLHAALRATRFNIDTIRPIPGRGVKVLIDGKPYCSFATIQAAETAIEGFRRNWPAVVGRSMAVQGLTEAKQ